jgi:ElaB/YqjD/DUF883 family membrane-anchored ribosome-binding protein
MATPVNRLESMWPQDEAAEIVARREAAPGSKHANSMEQTVEFLLRKHPKVAIAAAAAFGLALGWIVKRK